MPRLTTQAEESNPKRKGYDFRIDNQLYRAAVNPSQALTCLLYTSPSPRDS